MSVKPRCFNLDKDNKKLLQPYIPVTKERKATDVICLQVTKWKYKKRYTSWHIKKHKITIFTLFHVDTRDGYKKTTTKKKCWKRRWHRRRQQRWQWLNYEHKISSAWVLAHFVRLPLWDCRLLRHYRGEKKKKVKNETRSSRRLIFLWWSSTQCKRAFTALMRKRKNCAPIYSLYCFKGNKCGKNAGSHIYVVVAFYVSQLLCSTCSAALRFL